MAFRKDIKAIALALAVFAQVGGAAAVQASSQSEAKIRELIQSSEIVPIDYRQHVNIAERTDRVMISVYKAPDAEQADCKIDAILMAEKVLEAAPETKTVEVFFYDLAQQDKVWAVEVPTAAVIAYAAGNLDKLQIISAAHLTSKPVNTLASSYAGQSYKQIVEKLGVLAGPAQDQRALALVRIDELAGKGKETGEFRKQYLHIEDLTRRGDLMKMRHELSTLASALEKELGIDEKSRDAKLQSMLHAGANPQ
jgi:hypothetical protein